MLKTESGGRLSARRPASRSMLAAIGLDRTKVLITNVI